jgi:GTP-binding protein Era
VNRRTQVERSTTRFATVALAGRPNAGKSTLLNALVGEKLAISSAKPQSTRYVVRGIVTEAHCQLVFVDPPGLFTPANLLQRSMVESAIAAMNAADIVLQLHPIDEGRPPAVEDLVPGLEVGSRPVATVLTKADLVGACDRSDLESAIAVSAVTGEGLDRLKQWCCDRAPFGDFQYDSDDLSTQHLRFFASEMVREAAFEILEQELPYALAAEVDQFREEPKPVYIRVVLYVERKSQKGIVIGKNGHTIKLLGQAARTRIEALLGEKVFLDLWVKVLPKWRTSSSALRMLGLPIPSKERGR